MSSVPAPLNPAARPLHAPRWLSWLAAIGFAIVAALLAQLYLGARGELIAAREEAGLSRIEILSTRNQLEAERLVAERQLAELRTAHEQLARASALSPLVIRPLAARADAAPRARGAVVWSAERQEGVLVVSGLPPLPVGQTYRLWLGGLPDAAPVDAGAFTVEETARETRHAFKPAQPLPAAEAFFVSVEPPTTGDETSRPTGPIVLATP